MKYRREIDGLRALAIAPVVLFHAGFEIFSGGFVGVDVFFVVSGFLITSIIIGQKTDGTFSLKTFYQRRVRRILPALFTMCLLACIPAWFLLVPGELNSFGKSLVSVLTFTSNFHFFERSGYFDTAAELQPLLHTWSLAVEEQFYILFPLVVMALWGLQRGWLLTSLFALGLASFILAQLGVRQSPNATFFLLHTRAWELMIGSLGAFAWASGRVAVPKRAANALTLLGLIALVAPVVLYDHHTPFPSAYALPPTLGALLVLLFATHGTWAARLLSWRGFVGLGLISYSMYLLHQPMFVFARLAFNWSPEQIMLYLSVPLLALSFLSWRFVEQPARAAKLPFRRLFWRALMPMAAVIFILGTLFDQANGFPKRFDGVNFEQLDYASHWQGWSDCPEGALPIAADIGCKTQDPSALVQSIVIGDSHAGHLASGFSALEQSPFGNVAVLTRPCFLDLGAADPPVEGRCSGARHDEVLGPIARHSSIETIFISGYGMSELLGNRLHQTRDLDAEVSPQMRASFEQGLANVIELASTGSAQVVFLVDVPELPFAVAHRCLLFGSCANAQFPRVVYDRRTKTYRDLVAGLESRFPEVVFISLENAFCDAEMCRAGTESALWYQTPDHLTPDGARQAVSYLLGQMQ